MSALSSERAATTALFLANGLGIGGWAAALPALKAGFALTDGQLALALFAFSAGAVAAMALAARLAARMGSASAARGSAIAFATLLVLPALAPSYAALAASAFFLGFANGLNDVTMNAHASLVERRFGAAIMSSFHAAFSLGGLLGAGLGAALARCGAPVLLMATAALAAALVGAAWRHLSEGPRAANAPAHFARPGRALLPLAAMALLSMVCEGAMADWSGVYLAEIVKAPLAAAPAGFAAFSAAMVGGRLVGDRLIRRFGRARVAGAGAMLAALGLTLAVGWPNLAPATLGFGLVGLGLANLVPAVFSAAAALTASPAVGVAIAASAGYAGLLSGPVLIGALAEAFDLRLALAVLIVFAAVAALAARTLSGRAPAPVRPAPRP